MQKDVITATSSLPQALIGMDEVKNPKNPPYQIGKSIRYQFGHVHLDVRFM